MATEDIQAGNPLFDHLLWALKSGTPRTAQALESVNGALKTTPVDSNGIAIGGSATLTDKSGTITLGATAQVLMAANASRKGYSIQNNSSGDLWFNSLAAAVASQPSYRLAPGALYETPSGGVPLTAISLYGATTGQAFSAREW